MSCQVKVSSESEDRIYTERIDLTEYDEDQYSSDELRPLSRFNSSDVDQYNGNHFIFGWWECFAQSDDVAHWMNEDPIFLEFIVE